MTRKDKPRLHTTARLILMNRMLSERGQTKEYVFYDSVYIKFKRNTIRNEGSGSPRRDVVMEREHEGVIWRFGHQLFLDLGTRC